MSAESTTPVEIDLERTKQLTVRWSDGHTTVLPLVLLRKACPCASCRTAREERERNPLTVVKSANEADMIVAEDAQLVGHYALRIRWRDGHETGIYDFRYLRSLDPDEQRVAEASEAPPPSRRKRLGE